MKWSEVLHANTVRSDQYVWFYTDIRHPATSGFEIDFDHCVLVSS